MKSFVAIATVALLTNSAIAATCDSSVLTALLTDQYIEQCSSDSGYDFTDASIPTQEIIDKMCASSACLNLLADAQTMNLTECTLPVGDNIELLADLIDYVPPRCSSASGSTSVSAGSMATDTSTNATDGGSADTITVPENSTSSTTSSSTGETSTTTTSAPTAASASSSGSSAASTVTRAVGAASLAVVAVGAYFL